MASDNIDEALVGFFTRWKIILGVRKCVIKVEVVYVDCDALEARVALIAGAEPLVVEHCLAKAKITGVKHSAHLAFEEEHDCARAVECVHQHDLYAFLLLLIKVDPVLFVHL